MKGDPPKLVLGTANLGMAYGKALKRELPSERHVEALLDYSLSLGVNRFDTAVAYGESEARLGRYFSGNRAKDGVFISTKLSPDLGAMEPIALSAKLVRSAVETSSAALGVDTLDQLLLHRWTQYDGTNGYIWNTLLAMQRKGKIKRLGVSVQSPAETFEALEVEGIETIQLACNLLDWRYDEPVLAAKLRKSGIVRIEVRSLFLQGLLTMQNKAQFPIIEAPYDEETVRTWLRVAADRLTSGNLVSLCIRYALSLNWADALLVGVDNENQLMHIFDAYNQGSFLPKDMHWIRTTRPRLPVSFLDPSQWQ